MGKNHFGEPLYKYVASTFWIAAPKTAGFETNSNGKLLSGKVLELAEIMAVAGTGELSTVWATGPLEGSDFKSEPIFIALNAVEQ